MRCPFVDKALEVSGTFDLIVQGRCGSHADYTENLEKIRPQIARFVTRIETSFIGREIQVRSEYPEALVLWLPCKDGRKQVQAHTIDKVVAEGDYMRVHVGSWDCLLHQTMHRFCEQLKDLAFIKLHRSMLVRVGFIDRLTHRDARWTARLCDGTDVIVAKSHVRAALRLMAGESSKAEVTSPASSSPIELRRAFKDKAKMSVN